MRHRKRKGQLGRMADHRDAAVKNLVRALFKSQRIQTTLAKAKESRRLAERLISLGKRGDLLSRRKAFSYLTDRDMVKKLFGVIAPLFKARNGGYTRIIRLGFRRGDGAVMALLELTEKKMIEKPAKKKAKKAEKAPQAPEQETGLKGERPTEAKAEKPKEAKPKEARPEEAKPMQKAKPTLREEKAREKAKVEDKKIKDQGFFKNLKGFFKRKRDM